MTALDFFRLMKSASPEDRRQIMREKGFAEEQITDYLNYLESETEQGDLRRS